MNMDKYKLEYYIKKNNLTKADVCEKVGIGKSTFYKKLNGKSEFTQNEIKKLIDLLHIEDPVSIFFN